MDIYLTDSEYLNLLKRARQRLDQVKEIRCEDSTEIGFKHTLSNVGLCDDGLTTKEIALFPKEFPKRCSMKYQGRNHKCPLDGRKKSGILGWGNGCFFKCLLFQGHLNDIKEIKRLYDKRISDFERKC